MTGYELVEYAHTKIGTPYFFGCKMELLTNEKAIYLSKLYPNIITQNYLAKAIAKGQIGIVNTDCSGLISGYTGMNLSSSQLYSTAYTRLPIYTSNDWADGVVVWRNGHVGIFYHNLNGEPIVIEAKGIDYGTVYSIFNPNKWSVGLTFSWIEYSYDKSASLGATYKGHNPYPKPTTILREGSRSENVKWLQYELIESGYDLSPFGGIDGEFGTETLKAVTDFQTNTNLLVDGEVGPETINALTVNEGDK